MKYMYVVLMTNTPWGPRPFTALVEGLRKSGFRYQDLVTGSGEARSSAWFNNLVNGSTPWVVSPPAPDTWPRLAALFNIEPDHLQSLIAEEWFGPSVGELTTSQRALLDKVKRLSDEDLALLGQIAKRLDQPLKTLDDHLNDLTRLLNDADSVPPFDAGFADEP